MNKIIVTAQPNLNLTKSNLTSGWCNFVVGVEMPPPPTHPLPPTTPTHLQETFPQLLDNLGQQNLAYKIN